MLMSCMLSASILSIHLGAYLFAISSRSELVLPLILYITKMFHGHHIHREKLFVFVSVDSFVTKREHRRRDGRRNVDTQRSTRDEVRGQ
jgi:hypothetical protein